ncbi:acyl-CoA dehydrogenase family protein [Aquabacter spiritensis]|uniref:Acyl-CoA dehydrogenase n=1 Tax=Aquabacter spiritensis TaxID=933073 RepID=A0A4R3LZZ0_9HYPH|nr:acyl-CoA dehydrogenase family protein [Aquabacter spiritensis]TCT05469.1 acyl-CoA dehydrogenase [Aquabacter spiritensis]
MHGAAPQRQIEFPAYLAKVRAFSREVLRPAEDRVEDEDAIPAEIVSAMRDLGLFGISLPAAYGGLGWNMEQQVLLTLEFTQASAVYRSRFSTTIGLTSQVILDYGTPDQRRRCLPAMAAGIVTGAFCLTEEAAGSDAGAVATRAVRDGSDYVITGVKRYITNAPDADLFLVIARTGPEESGGEGLSCFLVERGTPGLVTPRHSRMMGQRGSHVGEVHLDQCRVPAEALLGGREGNGLKMALRGINHARTHVAATCVGQAMRLMEEAVGYLNQRQQFGSFIGEFQALQVLLGESQAEVSAARALVLDCARQFDQGPIPHGEIACAKLFASEMVCRVADRVVQMFGGQGYLEERAVARLYRDVRLFRIFEGTSQIQQINIAKRLLRAAAKEG